MPWTTPAIVFLIVAALRGGGTLADAARYEAIRRAITPPATRSLTMADLPAADPAAKVPDLPAKPESSPVTAADTPAKADDSALKGTEPTEAEWRAKMAAARSALERDEVLAEAMQGRVNSLTTESLNRDDPAQREEILRQRSRALAELDRITLQIAADKLAIVSIEDDARKKGIPPGWIR